MKLVARRKLAFATALIAFLGAWRAGAADPPEGDRPPNVLFIVVDDLNDWVGHLGGHPDAKTPNIDQLASLGVSFTNAHSPAVSCNPARVAVLSGLRPSTTGIYSNRDARLETLEEVQALPQYFKAHGYRVLGAGKILHSLSPAVNAGFFDEYFKRPPPLVRAEKAYNGTGNLDWQALEVADHEMSDDEVVSWALEKLAEDGTQPMFLALGIVKPHLPWYVPEEYFAQYAGNQVSLPQTRDDDLDDIPPLGMRMAGPENEHKWLEETGKWKEAVRGYLATISFVDHEIGRLMQGLKQSAMAENTVVVLWSDHGMHLGEKQHWKKSSLWEESTRVPLVFVAPGVAQAGGRSNRPVDTLSIYPTLAELCGLPIPEHVEGASLMKLLREPEAPWDGVALTAQGRGNHAVRSERWRYIRYADGSEELYDHLGDPMEWNNLANDPSLEEVKRSLARWLPDREAPEARARAPLRSRTLFLRDGRMKSALVGSRERIRFALEDLPAYSRMQLEIRDITDRARPLFWSGESWQLSKRRVEIRGHTKAGRWENSLIYQVERDSLRHFRVQAYGSYGSGDFVRTSRAVEFSIDSGAPEITIETPAGAVFRDRISVAGTVRDNYCLAELELEISQEKEGRAHYWNGTRWQPSFARVKATLDKPGARESEWHYRFAPPFEEERRIGVRALATDCAGNSASVARGLWSHLPADDEVFELRATAAGYVVDTEVPELGITPPPSAVFGEEIRIAGEAVDDLCVAEVDLLISTEENSLYWDGSRWQGNPVRLAAALDRRGARQSGWSYSFAPPFEAERRFGIRAQARDCARNAGLKTRRFWSFATREPLGPKGFAVDSQAPVVTIATPGNAVFDREILLAGEARDELCLAAVELFISEVSGDEAIFWDGDRWQESRVAVRADLDRPGPATGWRYAFTPPFEAERRFGIRAQARDCARNTSVESRRMRSFAAQGPIGSEGFVVDTQDPTIEIVTPSSAVFGRQIRLEGSARDDVCVAGIELLISTGKGAGKRYWDGSRWRGSRTTLKATLADRGAPTSSWRYAFEPPRVEERDFALMAFARDCATNTDKGRRRFESFTPAGDRLPGAIDGVLVDTEAPTIAITTPRRVDLGGEIRIQGEAHDDACVASVELSIRQDRMGRRRFWNGERWQGSPVGVSAKLGSRGTSDTAWQYAFEPPERERLAISVGARVLDCARNRGRDARRIRPLGP